MATDEVTEDATPNPEYLIKSIAEQGYSLETSLADLIDNSISAKANKIEILIDTEKSPFTLYLADNGLGMDEATLRASMQFPSTSPDVRRDRSDLGRFGLGMKTASFSQTRRFTVLSRKNGEQKYAGRTWDVELLKENKWKIIVNSDQHVEEIVSTYTALSARHLDEFEDFQPNTIMVWTGLYKFEDYLKDKNPQKALKNELTKVTSEHLELVFHRFMEDKENPLQIKVNNRRLTPFSPFPTHEHDFRPIEYKQRTFGDDAIKIEGFVLPSRSIDEVKKGLTLWTSRNRGLMDMEGIYIYRLNRIILFGGWNGLIKKTPRLQLARLQVDIGNNADHHLHLNVAKSQVIIPHDLKQAFESYIDELKIEAEREFYNRGVRKFPDSKNKNKGELFGKKASNKGVLLELNSDFPLINALENELSALQLSQFKSLMRMINTFLNKIRQSHEDVNFLGIEEDDGVSLRDLVSTVKKLKNSGLDSEFIKNEILPHYGFKNGSLPIEIMKELK